MSLLIQCLREVRALSGDRDLLPLLERKSSLGLGVLPATCDELGHAWSLIGSEFGAVCALHGGNAGCTAAGHLNSEQQAVMP